MKLLIIKYLMMELREMGHGVIDFLQDVDVCAFDCKKNKGRVLDTHI